MAHVRKQIRDAVIAELTGLDTTGSNVFSGRAFPIGKAKLPCLLIYTTEEESAPLSMGNPRRYERTVTLEVQAIVTGTSGYDDVLDQIAVEVEEAISADLTLGGVSEDARLTSTEIEFSDQAEKSLARITLRYEIDYEVLENDPETSV